MLFVTNLELGVGSDEVYQEMARLLDTTLEVEIDSNNVAWISFQSNQYTNILVNTIRLNGKFQVTRPLMWTWTIRESENTDWTMDQVKAAATHDAATHEHQQNLLNFT
jgi:hypothetical protein